MENRMAEDFLWFSYFGITKTDAELNKEDALTACIKRAYLDLCRTLSYRYSTSVIDKNIRSRNFEVAAQYMDYKKGKENLISCICNRLSCGIMELLETDISYDDWYEGLCRFLINVDNNHNILAESIQYGQAQKWINMSIKYMLVMGFWDYKLASIKSALHIPLDSVIFKAAGTDPDDNDFKFGLGVKQPPAPWSRLNYSQYSDYCKKLIDSIHQYYPLLCPIEWESQAWIEMAKLQKSTGESDN